jgi:hypothetical protein
MNTTERFWRWVRLIERKYVPRDFWPLVDTEAKKFIRAHHSLQEKELKKMSKLTKKERSLIVASSLDGLPERVRAREEKAKIRNDALKLQRRGTVPRTVLKQTPRA